MKDTITIQITDWYDLHKGYDLTLSAGYTALVGPNGAGKTTLLCQLREYAQKNGIQVFEYSNLADGGQHATQTYLDTGRMTLFATAATSSEGEQIAIHFGEQVGKIGDAVRKAEKAGETIFVLLDAIDSGTSIDRARDIRNLFDLISRTSQKAYVVMAVNHYELARDGVDCVNVRTGEHTAFASYDEYADFICSFEKKYKRREVDHKRRRKTIND